MKKMISLCCLAALLTLFGSETHAQKGYEKSIEAGTAIGAGTYSNTSYGISMINGYRFNDYFYMGVGIGFAYSNALNGVSIKENGSKSEYRTGAYLIPLFADFKANFTSGKISPFFLLNAGYTFDAAQHLQDAPGVMVEPTLGVDFKFSGKKALYALVGFNLQHGEYTFTRNIGTTSSDWEVSNKSEMFKAVSIRVGFKF